MYDKKRYCLAYNILIDNCKNKACPIYPCSFGQLCTDLSELFHIKKGFNSNDSRRIARNMLLNTFKNGNK